MAGEEFIEGLQELSKLPGDVHIFCPRETDGEHDRYEEDEGDIEMVTDRERYKKIQEARTRRTRFMQCTQLLAFDGDSSLPYQNIIYEIFDTNLKRCDVCVRRYHLERVHFIAQLRQEYQEQEIQDFLSILDRRDISRITEGLNNATVTLKATPEPKRGIGALEYCDLVALFEALQCRKFHENEALLRQHFDEPFKLVQSKRSLKISEILPAVTLFLFDTNPDRMSWAVYTWRRLSRSPTVVEWDYAIKDTLQRKIHSCNTPSGSNKLWSALYVVLQKLDSDAIAHKLFDLSPPFHRLVLDHLAQPIFSIASMAHALVEVFDKAPDAFWQSMGSISSKQLVESFLGSPKFDECLELAVKPDADAGHDVLLWISPFLTSLKAAQRPAACETLVNQLFLRIRSDRASKEARSVCLKAAVECMRLTICSFSTDEACRKSSSRLVMTNALDIVSSYAHDILNPVAEIQSPDLRTNVMMVMRNSLALDCYCLKADFDSLADWHPLTQGLSTYTPDLWETAVNNLNENDIDLSRNVLMALVAFTGLDELRLKERYTEKQDAQDQIRIKKAREQFESYNVVFRKTTLKVSSIFEKLSLFKPDHFDTLFSEQQTSMILFTALCSGDEATYQATLDIIKAISGTYGRKEALSHLLQAFFGTSLYAIDWVFRRLANMRTFFSIPRMLKIGKDVMELLCESQGILRSQKLDTRSYSAVQSYWSYQWAILRAIFRHMEQWSMEHHDKQLMMDVCRDTMQYAEQLFDQYHLFLNVLRDAKPERADEQPKILLDTDEASSYVSPAKCLYTMSAWLRLRDQYLADTIAKLLTNMLGRLKEYGVVVKEENLHYLFGVVVPDFQDPRKKLRNIRTILSAQQKAELLRALELYLGRALIEHPSVKKQAKIKNWATSGERPHTSGVVDLDSSEYGDDEIKDSDLYELSEKHEMNEKVKALESNKQQARPVKPLPSASRPPRVSIQEQFAQKEAASRAFIEKRKSEQAAAAIRRKEAALRLRDAVGVGEQTAGAGSGLNGIGIQGKDHAQGQSSLMLSSDSEGDSDDDEDDELFGKIHKVQSGAASMGRRVVPSGPVRKIKQVRSQKDIRARLAPDLSGLHKEILSWDFFADSDTPPTSSRTDYTLVTNTFKSASEYVKTFEPLLVLEGWQSFRAAREDNSFRPFELKVASSLIVDNFFEVTTVIPMSEGKERRIMASEVVLFSKGKSPHEDKDEPHCLARCKEVTFKKGQMQVVYRVNAANNPMRPYLNDKTSVYGVQILSLTPLEREYSALMALQYYDLCDEIVRAKPSPLLDYPESSLGGIKQTYDINSAQAKAVKSAIDNDAFTLVQGPPGSGKTKTICAIVGAILTGFLNRSVAPKMQPTGRIASPPSAKKILVCAPSNAAVDELVMRFKQGVKTMDGAKEQINVVRLGKSDAINNAVKDVTLEELVSARLGNTAPQGPKEDVGALMMEHKSVAEEFRNHTQHMDQIRAQGKVPPKEDEQLLVSLKAKRNGLGNKIDELREKQNSSTRDADLQRRRVQQEILDTAHILCATLSGSGHDIFQSLNIEFETVIIDEAAQSIELSALIPLKYGCNKCILVGDPKQLPPTVLSRQAAKFQYEQSLFARMEGNHKKDVHLLDTQYRMHPEISVFPSKTFYDSRLMDGNDMAKLRARPWHHSKIFAPYRFFDVQGMSTAAAKGHSMINIAELNVAMQLYDRLTTDVSQYNFKGKVGIITPYKGQLKELKARFSAKYGERILSEVEFNTTDAFQGRESEIIIFSCVRATTTSLGFLNDIRRMNVGLTRAKCSLWVLGNSETLSNGEYWRQLVHDAKARNLYTDGDILKLLRRPLLTADMMRDDVVMGDDESPVSHKPSPKPVPSRTASTDLLHRSKENTPATSRGHETPPVHANRSVASHQSSGASTPIRDDNSDVPVKGRMSSHEQGSTKQSKTVSWKSNTGDEVKKGTHGPSGGRHGNNGLANCSRCGSNRHHTHECDNSAAQDASLGRCRRCNQSGHSAVFCKESRCMACGSVGHLQEKCTVPTEQHLSKSQREQAMKQEIELGRKQEQARERRAKQRLGEHGAEIPTVKSTAPRGTVLKRKREDDHNVADAITAPKATKVDGRDVSHDAPNGHGRPMAKQGSLRAPGAGRPSVSGPPQVIRRKKPTADDMFVKRK